MSLKDIKNAIKNKWELWSNTPEFWETVPFAVMGLIALLILIAFGIGIHNHCTTEYKIHQLGYPMEEARTIANALTDEQADTLIARQQYDSLIYYIVCQRYFIANNFERYLTYLQEDTTSTLTDVIAIVNVDADTDWHITAVPCDTTKGDLMLVNKYHYLDTNYKHSDMIKFKTTCAYKGNKAARHVVEAFEKMQKACKRQTGTQLMISSSYRSYERQIGTHKHYAEKYVAHPGYSEHQTGLCLDITSLEHPEKWSFGKSKEGKWMLEHCHEYGFILRYPEGKDHITGYGHEPWHLRYVGPKAATQIYEENITLDEYYAYYIKQN